MSWKRPNRALCRRRFSRRNPPWGWLYIHQHSLGIQAPRRIRPIPPPSDELHRQNSATYPPDDRALGGCIRTNLADCCGFPSSVDQVFSAFRLFPRACDIPSGISRLAKFLCEEELNCYMFEDISSGYVRLLDWDCVCVYKVWNVDLYLNVLKSILFANFNTQCGTTVSSIT